MNYLALQGYYYPTKMALSDFFSSLKSTIYADSEAKSMEEKDLEEKGSEETVVEEEEEEEPEDVGLSTCVLIY